MRPQALLARKLSLYARELAFAARIPASLPQRARFMSQTMAFHWRNWRGITRPSGARLQIPLRLAGKRHTVTVRPGAGDLAVLYEIFTRNAYAVGPEVLDPAGVRAIVDAGAHIGMASLYFADRYLNARILSIEPNPENFALLKANTAGEPRITPVQACLTGLPDQQVFIATSGLAWSFQKNAAGHGEKVPGYSMDQLCAAHGIAAIDLLKLDIEGGEEDVLAHPQFLSLVRVIVAELHGAYTLARFNADLSASGFKAAILETADEPDLVLAVRA